MTIDELPPSLKTRAGEERPALRRIDGFGSNPGNLAMHLYRPSEQERRRPLVVVLHGCTQTAHGFATASGWLRLADELDLLVLLPEQRAENNRQTCFSWFEPDDTRRGSGEVASISQMIEATVRDHGADAHNVYICGLSAGGAMTGAMLAAYPELFQGGAIIAGLPYGAATNTSDALDGMYRGKIKEAKLWGDLVRAASDHAASWPSVAIWHGTADRVVKPINAGELVKQWTNVHGVGAEAPDEDHVGTATRRVWRDARKRAVVTEYSVPGLGHGVPVDETDPPAPFFLPIGLSASRRIAEDWGLFEQRRDCDRRERRWLDFFGLKL